jgi:ABC-2 type transport system ATP-binding protein
MTLLSIQGLGKLLGGRWVLKNVNLIWDQPGTLVVRGENGAGKSTLLRIVAGVVPADAGDVSIAGCSLERDRLGALREIGYAPEIAELPAHLRVGELIALVAALKRCAEPRGDMVRRLGVDGIMGQRLGSLSLGQRRRACLLAALVGEPRLLVLDEPSNGLDKDGVAMLVGVLQERAAAGRSALVATHDQGFIRDVADSEVEMVGGQANS